MEKDFEIGRIVPSQSTIIYYEQLKIDTRRKEGTALANGQCHILSLSQISGKSVEELKINIGKVFSENNSYAEANFLEDFDDFSLNYLKTRNKQETVPYKYWGNELCTSAASLYLQKNIFVVHTSSILRYAAVGQCFITKYLNVLKDSTKRSYGTNSKVKKMFEKVEVYKDVIEQLSKSTALVLHLQDGHYEPLLLTDTFDTAIEPTNDEDIPHPGLPVEKKITVQEYLDLVSTELLSLAVDRVVTLKVESFILKLSSSPDKIKKLKETKVQNHIKTVNVDTIRLAANTRPTSKIHINGINKLISLFGFDHVERFGVQEIENVNPSDKIKYMLTDGYHRWEQVLNRYVQ